MRRTIDYRKQQSSFLRIPSALAGLLLLGLTAATGETPAAGFTEPGDSPAAVGEGHLHLRWSAGEGDFPPPGWQFRLEQSPDPGFAGARTLYLGRDTGTFTSGLPSGSTYFRIRTEEKEGDLAGPWSGTLEVQVRFPEPWLVALLVAAGAGLALTLLLTIVLGTRRARRDDDEEGKAKTGVAG